MLGAMFFTLSALWTFQSAESLVMKERKDGTWKYRRERWLKDTTLLLVHVVFGPYDSLSEEIDDWRPKLRRFHYVFECVVIAK
jgi:hypothetical protein